jgi:PAS domain S-box-containing protein
VLLTLQLVLLGAFGLLFLQAEQQARMAEKSKMVVVEGTSITRHLYDAAAALSVSAVYRHPDIRQRYADSMRDLEVEIGAIDNLAKDNPEDAERLHSIAAEAARVFTTLSQAKQILDGTYGIQRLAKIEPLARGFHPQVASLVDHVAQLVEKHKRIADLGAISQTRSRKLIVVLLALVALSDMAVAAIVVASFGREITDRLAILRDNALRLPKSEELHPLVRGTDEISELDRAFHDMAARLAEASARERVLLNRMPVGIIACNATGVIEYINPRTEEFTGYLNLDLISRNITEVLAGFDHHSIEGATQLLNELTDNKVSEFKVCRKDGSFFPAEISLARVVENEQIKLIYNLIDVTQRHEIERVKREFLAIVSHDLKTPLTSIRGCLKTVIRGAADTLDQDYLGLLSSGERESDRLIRLVSDLLDVARLEAGRMKLDLAACPLAVIFEKAVKSVELLASDHNITIEVDTPDVSVIADPDRVIQVLINLLANAIKYSPSGSSIHVLSTPAHESVVTVIVEDHGRGIPEKLLETIFERFEQTRDDDQAVGSGLGLAICKLMIENMAGNIGVTSEEGAGSKFWFTLPAVTPREEGASEDLSLSGKMA